MSSRAAAVPAVRPIIYLGMDVHKDSITIAVLPESAKAPTRLEKLPNELPKLKKWIERLARDGAVQACYEASWTSPELMDGGFRLLALCEADSARTLLGFGTRAMNACGGDCTSRR